MGGCRVKGGAFSDKVYTHDGLPKSKWKQSIPPMPTARASPGVLSLDSALVVAAGRDKKCVEIFKPEISQWYTTDALPSPCYNMQLVLHHNNCYVTGGENMFKSMDKTYCASTEDLLSNKIPVEQTTHDSGNNPQQPIWKTLANTPTYAPAVATLAGYLVVMGGDDEPEKGTPQSEIQIYSPSTNSWINTFELPKPLVKPTAATLSSTETLVVGGSRCVYTGTVTFDL